MQVKIDQVSDVKVGQYGPSSKIKCGNNSYFVNEDATPLVGKTVEITTEEKTSAKGNKYQIAKIVKVIEEAAAAQHNGHQVRWNDYAVMATLAHELAKQLEPDMEPAPESTAPLVDRSTARAAIINTAMIAFTNGKITLSEGEDDIPF